MQMMANIMKNLGRNTSAAELQRMGRCSMTMSEAVRLAALATMVVVGIGTRPAAALVPQGAEATALEDCNRRACAMLLERNAAGEDLKCDLNKTWPQSTIKRADKPL